MSDLLGQGSKATPMIEVTGFLVVVASFRSLTVTELKPVDSW